MEFGARYDITFGSNVPVTSCKNKMGDVIVCGVSQCQHITAYFTIASV